jgi:pimeloyl-ACP methyl ester carboxylesterase
MADPHQVERLILFHVLTPTAVKEGLFKLIFHGTERFKSSRHFLGKALSRLTLPRSVSRWVVHSQLGGLQRQSFGPLESWMEPLQQAGVLKSLGDLLVDIDSFDGLDQVKFSERLPKTWVIWGSENRILPLHSGRAFCKRARPVRFEVISGGGHWVMLERPVEVNAILRECLVDEESQVSWSSSRRSDSGSSTHARIVSRLD